jgi:serine/threonine-protein kinase RsbW
MTTHGMVAGQPACTRPDSTFRLRTSATPDAVRQALDLARGFLISCPTRPDRSAVEIVLAEILNNVAEHAYAGRAPGHARIVLLVRDGAVDGRVSDDGLPMPGLSLPDPSGIDDDTELANLPEGGYGWFLIRTLAEFVDYRRARERNILSFRIPAPPAPPAAAADD